MISFLHIKNIGIIEDLNIDFNEGLNVLTGETGAGKTLIIDADMRRPRQYKIFQMNAAPGLSNYLSEINDSGRRQKIDALDCIKKTEVENLGTCKELIINETDIKIISEKCNESYIKSIIETSKNIKNDFNKEFMQNRINKLKNGKAIIYVGGLTEIEIREKKMRFDDALCAINTLNGGALIGGGITLLKISDKLEENNEGDKIIKQTLTKPVEILIESVGLNSKTIENKIREENYNTIYNVKSNNFENLKETKIIDSYNVVIETIKNASSIANMLLNISSIIINENNFYKTNNNFTDEI